MADRDRAIIKVLERLNDRPLFINITYSAFHNLYDRFLMSTSAGLETEVVGSSKDGLKTARWHDVGDVDVLIYSRIVFDEADESTFEYRSDNPLFFHIPHPRKIQNPPLVDGKYLNARRVRLFDSCVFGVDVAQKFRKSSYSIMPIGVQTSDLKCATTKTISYADPVFEPVYQAPDSSVDHRLYFVWNTEHIVFAYLLYKCNSENVEFVRDMLYGAEHLLERDSELRSSVKDRFALLKQDFQRSVFGVHDLLYFKSDEFQILLTQAVDETVTTSSGATDKGVKPHGEYSSDNVPAIRCRAWPRTARSFITRPRVWPPKEVIDEIVKEGFRIVPKSAILEPSPLKDFILSFSHADVRLVRLLPEEARIAYRLAKTFYKCANARMGTSNTLKTYHLKQALLWTAEKRATKDWVEAGPLVGMRWLLEFLMEVLNKGFFPSFYVEGSNHICHFSTEDCDAHIDLFGKIHRNPSNFVKVVVDNELEYTRLTMPEDSFKTIQDPNYINSFTWMELVKLIFADQSELGGYDIDAIVNNGFEAYRQLHLVDPFNTTPHDNVCIGTPITPKELRSVDVFVQTVTQMDKNLFTVLETDIDESIVRFSEEWLHEDTLKKLYPQYDKTSDEAYGDHALAVAKLRLKYYGNVFHVLCGMLKDACYQQVAAFRNYDVRYIVQFVKELFNHYSFTDENVDDLFHFLFFFCHFTRLRHHRLALSDQILRSIREFLQEADVLMTVYFNPRLSYPQPVIVAGIVEVLGECFPRKDTGNADGCCAM